MTLTKIQQAAIAVQNGMQPETAAKKYGIDLKELNRQLAEGLNGGNPGEVGDITEFSATKGEENKQTRIKPSFADRLKRSFKRSADKDGSKAIAKSLNLTNEAGDISVTTRKDGSVKKTKEKNSDGTTTVTKYDDEGNVKKSRVKLSFKDKVKNRWQGVKNFGKQMVCNKDGKVSGWKVAGLVGTAAVLCLAAPVAGVLGAGAATVAAIGTACEVAGTVMAGALVVNGAVNVAKGEVDYQKAQDKASAESANQKIGEGVASIGMAALPKALSRVGKALIKPFEGLFKGKAKSDLSVKPSETQVKPNEAVANETPTDVKVVNTVYDENGVEIQNVRRMPNRNNPNNTTEITQTYNTENGKTTVEESTLVNTDPVLQRRASMLKYADDALAKDQYSYHKKQVVKVLREDPKLVDELYSMKNAKGDPIFKDEAAIFDYINAVSNGLGSNQQFVPDYVRANMNNPAMQQLMLTEESPAAAVKKYFKYNLWDASKTKDIKAESPEDINTNTLLQRRISMLKYADDALAKDPFSYHKSQVVKVLREDPKLIDELYYGMKNAEGKFIFKDEAAIFDYINAVSNGLGSNQQFVPDYVRANMNNPAMQQLMLTEESPAAAVKKFFKYNLWDASKTKDIKAENPSAIDANNVLQRRISMLKYADDALAKDPFSYHKSQVVKVLREDPKLVDELYSMKNAKGVPIFKDEAAIFDYINAVSNGLGSNQQFIPDYVRANMNNPAMQQLMLTEESPAAAAKKFFQYSLNEANKK